MADTEGFRVHVEDHPPLPLPRELEATARAVAASDACVLLLGERGTGKTVLARRIHEWSARSQRPFVTVDLASTSVDLIHSELFGHTKGAFTGAGEAREGMIRRADRGTAFLDEISGLSPETQGSLLTLFQEGRVRPVGSDRWVTVDVRLVCATNRDLRDMAMSGRFRPDLYDRCTRAVLQLPPLRRRREEFGAIVRRVIWTVLRRERPQGLRSATVTPDALASLASYRFPGNIRELESVAYSALVKAEDGFVQPEHIRAVLQERKRIGLPPPRAPLATVPPPERPDTAVRPHPPTNGPPSYEPSTGPGASRAGPPTTWACRAAPSTGNSTATPSRKTNGGRRSVDHGRLVAPRVSAVPDVPCDSDVTSHDLTRDMGHLWPRRHPSRPDGDRVRMGPAFLAVSGIPRASGRVPDDEW